MKHFNRIFILICLGSIFLSCNLNGNEEEKRKEMEMEKEKQEIFNGNVSQKPADFFLKGAKFKTKIFSSNPNTINQEYYEITFDDSTSSCTFYFWSNSQFVYQIDPVAEYSITGDTITFDFSKHSGLMSIISEDDFIKMFNDQYTKQLKEFGLTQEQINTDLKKLNKELRDFEYVKYVHKWFSEYKNNSTWTCKLSVDRKTIQVPNFFYPNWLTVGEKNFFDDSFDRMLRAENLEFNKIE